MAGFLVLLSVREPVIYRAWFKKHRKRLVNSELARKSLEKVGNPNVLVNLVSRRVRQLNSGGGASSRPLLADTTGLGVADIALKELVDDSMTWEWPDASELGEGKRIKKH